MENDMKFNALKTTFLVFNKKFSTGSAERTLDNWNGDLKLGNDVLKDVDRMKLS